MRFATRHHRSLVCALGFSAALCACVGAPARSDDATRSQATTATSTDRAAHAATVRIRNTSCGGVSVGSGVIVDAHVIVTNAHVVDGAEQLDVATRDGEPVTVHVAGTIALDDLAAVEVTEPLRGTVALAPTDAAVGVRVRAVGFPLAGPLTITSGRIIDYTEGAPFGHAGKIIRTDAFVNHGNSGGALLTNTGELAGIVFGRETATGATLAIPVSVLRARLAATIVSRVAATC